MSLKGKLEKLGIQTEGTSVQLEGANNSAILLGSGTSAAPVSTSVANKNFVEFRTKTTTTTAGSDTRGIYNRLYIAGISTGGGEALRNFTTVQAAIGTAHGMHNSLNFSSGSCSGQGIAGRNTIHVPNAAMTGGNYSALQAEIYSDGASSDPAAVTELSYIRIVNDGNATGKGKVDDKAVLMDIEGITIGAGNTIFANAATVSHVAKMTIDGTAYYLCLCNAAGLA